MKSLFLTFLLTLTIYSQNINANSNHQILTNKTLNNIIEENPNQFEEQIKEVQALLGRVEILEHKILLLEQKVEIIDKILAENYSNKTSPLKENKEIKFSQPHEKSKFPLDDPFDVLEDFGEAAEVKEISTKPIIKVDTSSLDKKSYDTALASYKSEKMGESKKLFEDFIKSFPNSNLQSNAYFWLGEISYKIKDFNGAAINYLSGYKKFPTGIKAADSLLKLALSLGELNRKKDACEILARLKAKFPSRPAALIKRAEEAKIKFGCK